MNVLGKVTWEFINGVRALRAFSSMLTEAAGSTDLAARPFCGKDHLGVCLDSSNYWLGVAYEWPEILQFATENRPVDPEAAARLGLAGVYAWEDGTGHGWHRNLHLDSEEVHFFARSHASQLRLLETFLHESLEMVKRIELPSAGASLPCGPAAPKRSPAPKNASVSKR